MGVSFVCSSIYLITAEFLSAYIFLICIRRAVSLKKARRYIILIFFSSKKLPLIIGCCQGHKLWARKSLVSEFNIGTSLLILAFLLLSLPNFLFGNQSVSIDPTYFIHFISLPTMHAGTLSKWIKNIILYLLF